MIELVNSLPDMRAVNAEWIKIKCLFDSYKDDSKVLFWCQDGKKAIISMTDGNMIIYNNGGDTTELAEFCDVLSPACIFSDYETLISIGRKPDERINIMHIKANASEELKGDSMRSDEIYSLLDVDGLSLPEYPYFAVDFCHRLNRGFADYFGVRDKCMAVSFKTDGLSIMNGIASHQKGYGKIALNGILCKNKGNEFLVCCRDKVKGFYEKNGFKPLYFGGYWVRNNEY